MSYTDEITALFHESQRIAKEALAERDQLKAELQNLRAQGSRFQGELVAAYDARDLWRSRCEKMAKVLRSHACVNSGTGQCYCDEALAEYEAATKPDYQDNCNDGFGWVNKK